MLQSPPKQREGGPQGERNIMLISADNSPDTKRREDGRMKLCSQRAVFFNVREKVLPGGIFVREKGSVSITTDQSMFYILGHQAFASVLRSQNAIIHWSRTHQAMKNKKQIEI